jgi:hypothetical protein
MRHRIGLFVVVGFAVWNPTFVLFGQSADDPMASPTSESLRFTPEMAKSIGQTVSRRVFARYELPEDKYDEAADAVARRMMDWAHRFDTPEYRNNAENMLAEMFDTMAEHSGPDRGPGMMPGLAMAFARNAKPALAPFQEAVNLMARDIRPMLPLKQQLRLGTDLAAFGAAFDAFEERVEQWEKGDVDPGENPFQPADDRVRLNEKGVSTRLEQAASRADRMMDYGPQSQWGRYLKNAIEYYALDEAQKASAEALLRDYEKRAEAITRSELNQQRKRRLLLWRTFWAPMTRGSEDTVSFLISEQLDVIDGPLRQLDTEFKRRVDEIPTDAQRQAAAQRAWDLLAQGGWTREAIEGMTFDDKRRPRREGNGETESKP